MGVNPPPPQKKNGGGIGGGWSKTTVFLIFFFGTLKGRPSLRHTYIAQCTGMQLSRLLQNLSTANRKMYEEVIMQKINVGIKMVPYAQYFI